jgi:hypothetical protein
MTTTQTMSDKTATVCCATCGWSWPATTTSPTAVPNVAMSSHSVKTYDFAVQSGTGQSSHE